MQSVSRTSVRCSIGVGRGSKRVKVDAGRCLVESDGTDLPLGEQVSKLRVDDLPRGAGRGGRTRGDADHTGGDHERGDKDHAHAGCEALALLQGGEQGEHDALEAGAEPYHGAT